MLSHVLLFTHLILLSAKCSNADTEDIITNLVVDDVTKEKLVSFFLIQWALVCYSRFFLSYTG